MAEISEFTRRTLHTALAALALSGAACHRPPAIDSPERAVAESTFAEQARAVRDGRSDTIRLDHVLVTDADLERLDGLEDKLVRVNLSRTTISDAGLARLGRCRGLEQLRLASPAISDEGLKNLAGLAHLRFLHFIDAPVTDAGLDQLHGLSKLESLYLDGARATDEGIARFIKALPHVHFHIDGGHARFDRREGHHTHADEPQRDPQR